MERNFVKNVLNLHILNIRYLYKNSIFWLHMKQNRYTDKNKRNFIFDFLLYVTHSSQSVLNISI
jgi:hypothetical protein